jgi:hypothetical protein
MRVARIAPEYRPRTLVAARHRALADGLLRHRVAIRDVVAMNGVVPPLHRVRHRHNPRGRVIDDIDHIDLAVVPVHVTEEEPY